MLKSLQNRNTRIRIIMGFIIGTIAVMMVITLVPGSYQSDGDPRTTVASIGGYEVSTVDVQRQLSRLTEQRQMPPALRKLYVPQIADQLIYEKILQAEADRLGIRVTDDERTARIKLMLPFLFTGETFAGMDRYTAEVQNRLNMTVPEFEERIRLSLLEEKFRQLVTDGIRVTPEEVLAEFKRRNEKVKLDYVVVKPDQLEAKIHPSDPELSAYYEKHKAKYMLPERRVAKYILLDNVQLAAGAKVTEDDLRAYYNEHIERFRVQNRAKVSQIRISTAGKTTDAEIEEIRKKADDVLKKARAGPKFADLAKQYSDDASKDKGGDLGWITQGQTLPAVEQAIFSLPIGKVSDLIRTDLGFHIVKVEERETARTKSLDEVRGEIQPIIAADKADRVAEETAGKLGDAVRRSGNQPIEAIARQFNLDVREIRPVASGDPILELGGKNAELEGELFRMNPGEISQPIRLERGYVVLSLKEIQPSRQGTLAEVRDKALEDVRRENSAELARTLAESLAKRLKGGETFAPAAKALKLEVKTSDAVAVTGSISDLGGAKQFADAFKMSVGQASPAVQLGGNWVVYRVAQREEVKIEDLPKQSAELQRALLSVKQGVAYEAFRDALKERLVKEGKLKINQQNLEQLSKPV
jgi:peptidyl-prolyl cis-trans isomerase D